MKTDSDDSGDELTRAELTLDVCTISVMLC